MNTDIIQHDPVIVRLMQAGTALAEAKTMQHTKAILDVAAAAEIYAKRQQLGEEAIGIAHSVKIEALRKLGEMLKATPKNEGQIRRGTKMEPRENQPQTLAELGLDKKTSSIAQKLADLPDEAFEQVRNGHETVAKAIAAVKETKATQPAPVKPAPKVEPAHPAPDADMHAEMLADAMEALRDENESLRNQVAAMLFDGTDEEKAEYLDRLNHLTAENKRLEIMNRGLTEARDRVMRENVSLRKQGEYAAKKLKAIDRAAA